jgi:hypothetical protein
MASRSNVRQRIHFGFLPPPFSMPGSQPKRARSLSGALLRGRQRPRVNWRRRADSSADRRRCRRT